MCESGSLYWANWPKTWFTQFPNHNHWISESFCVRRGVSGFRALCKPPSKLSQLSLLTNLCEWYAVDRKCTDVVIWNTTKTGSVSKRALLTFYVQRFKKFVTREVKQQRFWATHVKRKWAFFFFNMPQRYQICIAKCLYSYRDDLPKLRLCSQCTG